MTSKIEKFGEDSSRVLKAMIKSDQKMLTSADIETETRISTDKVQDTLGWLIRANKISAMKDAENNLRYILVDDTYEKHASIIWQSLKTNGPQNIAQLGKTTILEEPEIHGALGWLARDNDIGFTAKGKIKKYSVR